MTHDPEYTRGLRALALGGVLQLLRDRHGWSVEAAAHRAGVGHMTWRRAEDGFRVRRATYSKLDRLLELPIGTIGRALNDDRLMVELAGLVVEVTGDLDPAAFVATFAQQTLSGSPQQTRKMAAAGEPTGERPLVVAVGELATRLAALPERDAATDAALDALLRLMPTLGATREPAGRH